MSLAPGSWAGTGAGSSVEPEIALHPKTRRLSHIVYTYITIAKLSITLTATTATSLLVLALLSVCVYYYATSALLVPTTTQLAGRARRLLYRPCQPSRPGSAAYQAPG